MYTYKCHISLHRPFKLLIYCFGTFMYILNIMKSQIEATLQAIIHDISQIDAYIKSYHEISSYI